MRIVQLTDLHIPPDGTGTQLGIDTRRNFLDMLPRAAALAPDLLVVSGDLCYDVGDAPTFTWIRAELDNLGLPYAVIAGNHDDSTMLGQAFGLEVRQREVYFTRTVAGHTVIFLDTAVATMSDTQLDWLAEQLRAQDGSALVFMHHPPFPAGMPFMDRAWPFRRPDDLLAVLTQHPGPVNVFCGHYHTERTVYAGNVRAHITPSLYFQLDPTTEQIAVEHTRSALRVIEDEAGQVRTFVRYFEGKNL